MAENHIDSLLDLAHLIYRQRSGALTTEEQAVLQAWLAANPANRSLFEELNYQNVLADMLSELDPVALQASAGRVYQALGMEPSVRPVSRMASFRPWRWATAAAVVAGLVIGGYYLYPTKKHTDISQTQRLPLKNDVAPGGNKAILMLASGQKIILDSAHTGTLARQGNTIISKTDSGKLAYTITNEKPTEVAYNVLTTPRGGQYQLALPDGSKVWLNAASSIRYPTAFIGKERTVEITGEAYLEVAKDKAKPFHVTVSGMEVDVLGTGFNINAYTDEPVIRTTLLEGAVKVTAGNSSKQLEPGQQAQVGNGIALVRNVDLDQVTAWKNGLFQFNRVDIQTVMRQLARWYDVDIVYEEPVTKDRFGGKLPRDVNVSEVLRILQQAQVHFRIEGKTIVVLP